MSAMPHLLHRAKRWVHAHMVRTRIAQLSELIDRIEGAIADDHDEVTSLRMELATERQRLRFLTQPLNQRREKTPCL
jgi:hypothetical protein